MNNQDVVEKIAGTSWFKEVDPALIAKLVECSHIRRYAPDEFVYLVGDVQTHVFFILDGRIKISIMSQNGEEFVMTMWEHGMWFGEGAFLEGATMPLEARAVNNATLLAVPIALVDKVLENAQTFYKDILQDLIGRSNQLYMLIEMLLFKPLRVRVVARMLQLVDLFGEENDGEIILPLQFSQSDFARMSGGSRQRINKIFRQWAADGIVSKKGKNHIVHDIEALRAQLEVNDDD